MDDHALLISLQSTDRKAVNKAWQQLELLKNRFYYMEIYNKVGLKANDERSKAIADEAFNDALLVLHTKVIEDSYDPEKTSIEKFLRFVAIRRIIDAYRKEIGGKIRDRKFYAEAKRIDLSNTENDEKEEREDKIRRLRLAMNVLKEPCKERLHLYYYLDKSVEQLRKETGITGGSLAVSLTRCRQALFNIYKKII